VRTPEFEAVHSELGERQIICDFRPDAGIRIRTALLQHGTTSSGSRSPRSPRSSKTGRLRAPLRCSHAVLTAGIPLLRESGISRCGVR